jgi:hypothetical protein
MAVRKPIAAVVDGVDSLAWAELYLGLAALVPWFDFELFDVLKERDIDYVGDFFLGEVRSDTHGVQVKLKALDKTVSH